MRKLSAELVFFGSFEADGGSLLKMRSLFVMQWVKKSLIAPAVCF